MSIEMEDWTTERATELYKINQWGLGYFTINELGNLCVKSSKDAGCKIDLKMLVDQLRTRKINPPILIRFMDILRDRINRICGCFQEAISANEYRGNYIPLFPIKVNQEKDVVTSILNYGRPHGLGLEAGSKAELLIVLALTVEPRTPIVCNGYKDQQFVEMVAMAHKMGKKIFPVIENYGELHTFIRHYKKTGIMPNLGFRIKLSTRGEGKWAKTAGDTSKFGLRLPEVMSAISELKHENLLDSLKLLHFHIGSQITKIKVVKQAIVETTRIYVELTKLGAVMEYVDIGGGLGVDYDGSSANTSSTINYSLEEYASDIVYRIKQLCDENEIAHPTIFSESGRFLSAHYSMLVTNVPAATTLKTDIPIEQPSQKGYGPVEEMFTILENMESSNLLECYHDAIQYRSEALNLFSLGYMSLPERAAMEQLFWKIMLAILERTKFSEQTPRELKELKHQLADLYYANFSLFQSVPDSWAIEQVFPVIPIHRLNERPSRPSVIADLTCDSDGIIEKYIGDEDINVSISLHHLIPDEPYYIGIFLIGAYQETLGELHNLFGDTHAVQIEITGENQYKIKGLTKGDTIRQVIDYVSYRSADLLHKMRDQIETAIENNKLTIDESAQLMERFEQGLQGYTYFED